MNLLDFQDIQYAKMLGFMDEDMISDAEDDSVDIDSIFGYVCCICDDGGDLLWYAPVILFI